MGRTVVDTFTYTPPKPHYEVEYLRKYPDPNAEEWVPLKRAYTHEVWTWPNTYEGLVEAREAAWNTQKQRKTSTRVVRVTENEQD